MGCAGSKPHVNQNNVNSPQKGFIIFNERTVEYINANESELRRLLKERCEHKLFSHATIGTNKKKKTDDVQQELAIPSTEQGRCLDSAIDAVLRYACNDFDIENFRSSNHLSLKQIRKDIMKKQDAQTKHIQDLAFYKKALHTVIDEFGTLMQEKFVDINDFKMEAKPQAPVVADAVDANTSAVEQETNEVAASNESITEQNDSETSMSLKLALEIARQNFYQGKHSMVCVTKAGGYVVREIDGFEKEKQDSEPASASNHVSELTNVTYDSDAIVPVAEPGTLKEAKFAAQISVEDVDISATFKTVDTTNDAKSLVQPGVPKSESSSLSAKSKASAEGKKAKKSKEELKKAKEEEERQRDEKRKAKEEEDRLHKEEQKKAKELEKKNKEEAEKRLKEEQRQAKEEKKAKEEAEKRQKEEQRKAKEEDERRLKEEQKKAKEQEKKAKLELKKSKDKKKPEPAKPKEEIVDHEKAAAVIVASVVAGASSTIAEEMLQQQQQQEKSVEDVLDAMTSGTFVCECQAECNTQLGRVNDRLVDIVKSAIVSMNEKNYAHDNISKAKGIVASLNSCKFFEGFDKGLHESLLDLEKAGVSLESNDEFNKMLREVLLKIDASSLTEPTDLKKEMVISILSVGEVLARTLDRYNGEDDAPKQQESRTPASTPICEQNELTTNTHDTNDVSITSPSDLVSSSAESTPCKKNTIQDDIAFLVSGTESTLSNHFNYLTNGDTQPTIEEYTTTTDANGQHVETHVVKEYVTTIIENSNDNLANGDDECEEKEKIECHVVHTTTTTIITTNGDALANDVDSILNTFKEVDKKVKYLNDTCSENDDDDDGDDAHDKDGLFKPAHIDPNSDQLQNEIKQITDVIEGLVQSYNGSEQTTNGASEQIPRSERKSSTSSNSNIPVRKSAVIQQQQQDASNLDDEANDSNDASVDVSNNVSTNSIEPSPVKSNGSKKNKNKKSKSKLPVKQ
jgi:hypothetical protein